MSATMTLAPSCAKRRASASPMPCPAPVMIATLSLRRIAPSCIRRLDRVSPSRAARFVKRACPSIRVPAKAGTHASTISGADKWVPAFAGTRVLCRRVETGLACAPTPLLRNTVMPSPLPALNLIAPPGQRHATLETAREIERRGFPGISVSSSFANMAQCTGLAFATERITFATAIAPIYAQTVEEFAHGAAYIHEISGGRFQFGIGVAHGPSHVRMGVTPGKPLADIRAFVAKYKSYDTLGGLPPVILSTLRK